MLTMFAITLREPLLTLIGGADEGAWRTVQGNYYNAIFLTANYFDVGFVRRGLGGSIARLFSNDPFRGALALHALSGAYLIAAVGMIQYQLLVARQNLMALFTAAFTILSPQLFAGWATDVGRTDMLVIGTIAWSCIALRAGRPALAAAVLTWGFLAHETSIIFGAPLALVIAAEELRQRRLTRRELVGAAALTVSGVAAIATLQVLCAPSASVFLAVMQRLAPTAIDQDHADLRDVAAYMMVLGSRGLKTAICYNLTWPGYRVMVAMSLIVTLMNCAALGLERRFLGTILAVVMPVMFMNTVANDAGRWVKFGCANAWLLSAQFQIGNAFLEKGKRLAARALILLALISMGVSRDAAVNRQSIDLYGRLGFSWESVDAWMSRCDPNWRNAARGRTDVASAVQLPSP
ncbi:MAG TPA: hypothetical protein VF637_16255 [Sphingomicrobium sp.]|jgi:hypothetical protein